MAFLKIAVVVMGVLIVGGTATLIAVVAMRAAGSGGLPPVVSAVLEEPAGARIAGIAATRDRLAVHVEGGGTDRIILIDPVTGALAGRISLAH